MSDAPPPNTLYYGDNLDVLRQHVVDASVDLVYLDPPFNATRTTTCFSPSRTARGVGRAAAAQVKAFKDTWRWDGSAAGALCHVSASVPSVGE